MPLPQMKAVAELLDPHSPYHFLVPSYQRGYRWTREQVGDLLNDISEFANPVGGDAGTTTYCLHPLVVKRRKWLRGNAEIEGWEVMDGQQRLSTLLLLVQELLPGYEKADGVVPYTLHCLALCELCGVANWVKLRDEAQRCYKLLGREEGVLNPELFGELYQRVVMLEDAQAEDRLGRVKRRDGQEGRMPLDKNAIGNLTLLNCRQNRALGNALFSTKQQNVLDASAKGQLVFPLTLEVFGKLNTKRKDSAGRWKNAWTREDAQIYRARLFELLGGFLRQNLSASSE